MSLSSVLRRMLLPVLLLAGGLLHAQDFMQSEAAREIAADPAKAGGVFYQYDFNTPELSAAPKGYKPFYISHYGRHGSRYSGSRTTYDLPWKLLRKGHAELNLTPRGEEFYRFYAALYPRLSGKNGDLTNKGQAQHRKLAQRMKANFPEVFPKKVKIRAESSTVQRVVISMGAFLDELRKTLPGADIHFATSEAFMSYLSPHTEMNPRVKWGDRHKTYMREAAAQLEAACHPEEFFATLFKDPSRLDFSPRTPYRAEMAFFMLWSSLQCLDEPLNPGPDLFTPEERFLLWQRDNFGYFGATGPFPPNLGRPAALEYTLLDDFLDKAEQDWKDGVGVRLRFGHDGVLMSFLDLLRLEGWHTPVSDPFEVHKTWQHWNVPMAANLQWIFYRNKKGSVLVRVLYNEKEAKLPLQPVQGCFYAWPEVRDFYRQVSRDAIRLLDETDDLIPQKPTVK